jgi:O-Antigen ligase
VKAILPTNKSKAERERTFFGKGKFKRDFVIITALALIHIPLGVALYNAGSAGILHPLSAFAFGMFFALRRPVNFGMVSLAVAYIVGAEVLWRMADIPVFWEFGKYASVAIMLTALVRSRRYDIPTASAVYIGLLIPACLMTVFQMDLKSVTPTLSFNMSGPLMLAVSCWFFYKTRIGPLQFRRLLFAMILPLLSVAMTAFFYTVTAEAINFTTESNFETSGGFGPNQVSAMLGLGVFLSVAGFILFKKWSKFSIYFVGLTIFFSAICVMTFSRGGIYNAIGGIVMLLIFALRDVGAGLRKLAPVVVVGAVFLFFVYPALDDFTGGALQERFEDTGTTNRANIAGSDFDIFVENPLFGIGVGAATTYRQRFIFTEAASHTEFSRMVSEHGGFGLGALLAMIVMVFINLARPNSTPGKAFTAGIVAWGAMFMMNTGMRLAAPGFVWGLSFITITSLRPNLAAMFRQARSSQSLGTKAVSKGLNPVKSF